VSRPHRVAIIGGGVAAMAAAFDLTDTPERRAHYQVTVHQMGWRLGGKGASGRDLEDHDKIHEHGVHVWGGYYHNAFLLMRRCYEALGRRVGSPMRTIDDAFCPREHFSVYERVDGERLRWDLPVPTSDGRPGDGRCWPRAREYLQLVSHAVSLLAARGQGGPGARRHKRRRARIMADYLKTHARGVVRDRLWARGTHSIDHEDWSHWLRRHGAREETLVSPLVRGIYDTMFAYRKGNTDEPALAAGRVLHTYARFMLGYRGSPFWELQGGMGDVVFAPLYEVLLRRGVRFEFFHRADGLHLDPDGCRIDRVSMTAQARTKDGQPYRPLVDIGGLPSWPARPLWDELQDGDRLHADGVALENPTVDPPGAQRFELRRGEDFDDVLLAVGRGAVPTLCSEVVEHDPRWRRMLHHTPTVMTHALQVWADAPAQELPLPGAGVLASGGTAPLAVAADMTHVVARESWGATGPRSCTYLCGVLDEREDADPFDPSAFVAEQLSPLQARARATFYERNAQPSDRYTLTPPGSIRHRFGADESGLQNLYLAGDWARTSYSLGTVESACISGRNAAQAILGEPLDIVGE